MTRKPSRRTASIYPWTPAQERLVRTLNSPAKIQAFLDKLTYNLTDEPGVPGDVIKHRRAHCFDGAVFAASVFSYHGCDPLLIDLCSVRDDDHILAVFRSGKFYGAVAKSNYTGLRFREPLFSTPRELVMSYFESYFNLQREKTLRAFSLPFNMRRMKAIQWEKGPVVFDDIADALIASPHKKLISRLQERALLRVDSRTFKAGLVGLKRS